MKYFKFFLVSLCFSFSTIKATVVVTNGLTHKYDMVSSSTQKGYVTMKNVGKTSQRVLIYKNDLNVACGSEQMDVADPGTKERSNASWIKVAAEERLLAPGEEFSLQYLIESPDKKLSGTYWSLLMIEVKKPIDTATIERGIQVTSNVRYAVQIVTDFQGETETKVSFEEVNHVNLSNGKGLSVRLMNDGEKMVQPMVKLEVYDSNGETIYSQKADTKKLYPNQCRNYIVPIDDLPSGSYQAVLVADCGESDLFGMTINLQVDE